jgi:uncharacterized protein RhaS with RHS repeats
MWLSRDPLGENAGINVFAYVGNNPINFIDPYGLDGYWSSVARNLVKEGHGVLAGAQAFDELAINLAQHPIDTSSSVINNLSNASAAVVDNINQAWAGAAGYIYQIPQSSATFACNAKNSIINNGFEDYGSLAFQLLAGNAVGPAADMATSTFTANNLKAFGIFSGELTNMVVNPEGALRYTPDPEASMPEVPPAIVQTVDRRQSAGSSPPSK